MLSSTSKLLRNLKPKLNFKTLQNYNLCYTFSSMETIEPSWKETLMTTNVFRNTDTFPRRHIGPDVEEINSMLDELGYESLDHLMRTVIPEKLVHYGPLGLDSELSESEALSVLNKMAKKNEIKTNLIGMGYYETVTPYPILRNLLENPGWYTSYTPYQAEVSQGRLEGLLNFQTMICDLTGMEVSNASLLDEGTAAAEAMAMTFNIQEDRVRRIKGAKVSDHYFVADNCHPQTIGVMETRAKAVGVKLIIGNPNDINFNENEYSGILLQYPDTYGSADNYQSLIENAHNNNVVVSMATDILASTLLKPAGEIGADIVVGSAQRFGVPLGFGGPHAGFLASKESYLRKIPGRIIGISKDSRNKEALRMALQTREQHIRKDKATSNICTAQALLANIASMYAVYHGPEGLKKIAERIHRITQITANILKDNNYKILSDSYFDTIHINVKSNKKNAYDIQNKAAELGLNFRIIDEDHIGLSFGEVFDKKDMFNLLKAFDVNNHNEDDINEMLSNITEYNINKDLIRESKYLEHRVFNIIQSESELVRYLKQLENKDLALNTSMISLGSCTMKLNSASEMIPITWTEFTNIHPFAPENQTQGYKELIDTLNEDLAKITKFDAISLQPNSGANGEFAGLMCIKKYLEATNQHHRKICFIPSSAHGTNPASAAMAGMKIIYINSDDTGGIDLNDLSKKLEKWGDNLAAYMVTYPSTFGTFDPNIKETIEMIHNAGGQVYMDGANMNAQIGYTSPGFIGADVCHLNLHKTFCIPHGGGGPGVGAIGVRSHLKQYLPGHNVYDLYDKSNMRGAVASAPYGSALILPISWMYIKMMGEIGLTKATQIATLSANYMASRLSEHYPLVYRDQNGLCAHEFIIDLRPFKKYGIKEEDVAKRLQDYGFHSPTMSWPIPGTLMVEPTESEDKLELDRFCDSMIQIRREIQDVIDGEIDILDSPLRNAPHTHDMVINSDWDKLYSREYAVYPLPFVQANKYWPPVGRVDNTHGDRNLICTCPTIEEWDGNQYDLLRVEGGL